MWQMDTIGDAYIAVGFLRAAAADGTTSECVDAGTGRRVHPTVSDCRIPIGDDCCNDEADPKLIPSSMSEFGYTDLNVCKDVLHVAREMILELRDYRRRTGLALHCRIGIGMGSVVAGVLGQLQPRCTEYKLANDII